MTKPAIPILVSEPLDMKAAHPLQILSEEGRQFSSAIILLTWQFKEHKTLWWPGVCVELRAYGEPGRDRVEISRVHSRGLSYGYEFLGAVLYGLGKTQLGVFFDEVMNIRVKDDNTEDWFRFWVGIGYWFPEAKVKT